MRGGPRGGPGYASRGTRNDTGRSGYNGRGDGHYGPGQDHRQQHGDSGGVGTGSYPSIEKKRRLDETSTADNGTQEQPEAESASAKCTKNGDSSDTHEGGENDNDNDENEDNEEDMEGFAQSLEPEGSAAVVVPDATAEPTTTEGALAAAGVAAMAADVVAAPPVLAPPTKRDRRMFGALMGHLAAGKKDSERSAARLEARKQVRAVFEGVVDIFPTCQTSSYVVTF